MQHLTNFPSLIDRWLRYQFQTILVVCFLLWTPLLVIETLQIQHSCHPMIHWSGTLPAECQPKTLQLNSSSSKKPDTSPPPPPPDSNLIEQIFKTVKEHPDITGGIVAIGVASIVTGVAAIPLAAAVGIGAAVWFAIRTVV